MAQSQGVKVIAYDRPIPTRPADFYVSFTTKASAGDWITRRAPEKEHVEASDGTGVSDQVPTDAAAGLIKKGIHAGSTQRLPDSRRVRHAGMGAPKAQQWQAARSRVFGRIPWRRGRQRGTAGGASQLQAAGVEPVPRSPERCYDRSASADHTPISTTI